MAPPADKGARMKFAVIGAGLAGLTCAAGLSGAGHAVALFDKGRGAGGRMASRRVRTAQGEIGFDHGAQYMTAHDPAFRVQLEGWAAQGLAARWPAAGDAAWVGVPSMNAPLRHLADALGVRWSARVEAMVPGADGWRLHGDGLAEERHDGVVVAVPAEQAAMLLAPVAPDLARRAADTPSLPCWTLMAAFAERLPIPGDVLKRRGAIDWASRNSAKPGRGGPEAWVVHATPDWSRSHLEDEPDSVRAGLLALLAAEAGGTRMEPLTASVHRWRYARSGGSGDGLLWDPARRIGVCGDWLLGPRVESAFLSGRRLAEAIGASLFLRASSSDRTSLFDRMMP